MSQQRVTALALIVLLFALGLAARLMPHPPNLVPISAIAMFAGFIFGRGALAVAIPLSAMLLGDAIIGAYDYRVMAVVYAALTLPVAMSWFISRVAPVRIVVATVASSFVFFAATNMAVWYFGTLYDHTTAGLVDCYVSALPFFRNTLVGDLAWAAVLFGGYALASGSMAFGRRQRAYVRVER